MLFRSSSGMPVGGIDANRQLPGQQLMPPPAPMQQQRPGQPPQGQQAPGQAPGQQPPSAGPSAPGQMGNMLSLTPQGQTMSALQPQRMAKGGKMTAHAKAHAQASLDATKYLGLPEGNTAEDRAKAMGFQDFLHGTERLDRLLSKKGLDPQIGRAHV